MLNFIYEPGGPITEITSDLSKPGITRNEIATFDQAKNLAADATSFAGDLYLPIDNGQTTWPRFDVVKAPKVGDVVSKGFNGDYYPCGEIITVSASMKRIVTSNGLAFYRRRETAAWVNRGTWTLVPGEVNERNPSF
jgi:hypothetical protein